MAATCALTGETRLHPSGSARRAPVQKVPGQPESCHHQTRGWTHEVGGQACALELTLKQLGTSRLLRRVGQSASCTD